MCLWKVARGIANAGLSFRALATARARPSHPTSKDPPSGGSFLAHDPRSRPHSPTNAISRPWTPCRRPDHVTGRSRRVCPRIIVSRPWIRFMRRTDP